MIRPYKVTLPKKQNSNNSLFVNAWKTINLTVPRSYADYLVEKAAAEVRRQQKRYAPIAYGWSGGKDSMALKVVMDAAGVDECMLAISRLEYPEFLSWCTNWMPNGLTVIDRKEVNLEWLIRNPNMLFPKNADIAGKWFQLIQRMGQKQYYSDAGLGALVVGRRIADGNYPRTEFKDRTGRVWISPILHWTHEDVMAVCKYYGDPLPPTYSWPRGWSVGTGAWAARQWCRTIADGWREVKSIDPDLYKLVRPHFA